MKLSAALLSLFALESANGFMFQGPKSLSFNPQQTKGAVTLNDTNDYLGRLKTTEQKTAVVNGYQTNTPNTSQTEKELEQRLSKLAQTERALEQRLAKLSQTERALEQRLASADRTARSVGPMSNAQVAFGQNMKSIENIWETSTPTTVQGGSLRTWSYANPAVNRVYVLLKTDGRPLDADVELWQGPDNTPNKMKVYVEDGAKRTFSAFIDTPRSPNTICIKNTGHLEFPLYACVGPDKEAGDACLAATRVVKPEVIQGGALRTYPFEPEVDSVAVLIKTDGRPLNARIELLQGPNNNKQVLELYTEDGLDRPFMAVVQTPGSGNVVRVVNTAPVEFPMYATVAAYEMVSAEEAYATDGVQIGREW